MKKYKSVLFDWDGTAVMSRSAPADDVAKLMKPLLSKGIKLCIISGTTYENIAGGKLHEFFTKDELKNLYLGLGRGAFNYGFDDCGKLINLGGMMPDRKTLSLIHKVTFDLHTLLFENYGINTDIVFNRPNYCKLDLMSDVDRGQQLFFQASEAEKVIKILESKGYNKGLKGLIEEAENIGKKYNLKISATTDAKYLEIGLSTKSDNVDFLLDMFKEKFKIAPEDCCFFGDEYLEIGDGIFGSDSYMFTEKSLKGDFFDVSEVSGKRPEGIKTIGGGVKGFSNFLSSLDKTL